jgi:hypothetical protein
MMRIILLTFSQFVRGFWQFWSLGGFDLMVLALPSSAQASFFCEADDESSVTATDHSNENIAINKRKRTSYSEILTYALPESTKVIKFNNLVNEIIISQQQTSLIERNDAKTAEAMIVLANILEEHWEEFPLKVKVLLLNKLKVFKKGFWKYFLTSIPSIFRTIKGRVDYYKGFLAELKTYDGATQSSVLGKVLRDSRFLKSAWITLKVATLKIFKNDGYLLEENRESISEFANSLKTMVAARQIMNEYSSVLEELAKSENDDELVHTFNYKGEPCTYNVKDLHWNPKAYDYLKEQENIFYRHLPSLVENFGGRYVVFENGLVIDSDEDENSLLDRIGQTEFYKQRPDAILFTFVPRSLPVNA